ncbi:hypothetical protein KVG76_004691 [Salmonella enterica]|nr:hypothetical protein [Salmonella enterica]
MDKALIYKDFTAFWCYDKTYDKSYDTCLKIMVEKKSRFLCHKKMKNIQTGSCQKLRQSYDRKTALTGQANPSQAKTSLWLVLTCEGLRFYHSDLVVLSSYF